MCVCVRVQVERYDKCMAAYESGAVRTAESLAALNLGQSLIFTTALTAAMLSTAQVGPCGVRRHT